MIINGVYYEDPSQIGLPGSDPGGAEHIRIGGESLVSHDKIQGPVTAEDRFIHYASVDAGPECCEKWFQDICTFVEHRQAIIDTLRKIWSCGGANEQANWHDVVDANKLLDNIISIIDPPLIPIPVCGSAGQVPNAKDDRAGDKS